MRDKAEWHRIEVTAVIIGDKNGGGACVLGIALNKIPHLFHVNIRLANALDIPRPIVKVPCCIGLFEIYEQQIGMIILQHVHENAESGGILAVTGIKSITPEFGVR